MKRKEMIRMINEEIGDFDFLNNEAYVKEKETYDLIQNEDFQKQFLIDSILNRKKIKEHVTDARLTGDWENRDSGMFGVEYYAEIEYQSDSGKDPSKFILTFDGDNVPFSTKGIQDGGDYLTAPSSESWFDYIDWSKVVVGLSTVDGDDIKFAAFERAPVKIKNIFIREYLEEFITHETQIDIKEPKEKISSNTI